MASDFDELPFTHPDAQGPTINVATVRKCYRHKWLGVTRVPAHLTVASNHDCFLMMCDGYAEGVVIRLCSVCGKPYDPIVSKRGKSARNRGNAYERELALRLGGKRVGQYGGPDDVTVNDLFTIQSKVRKAFPSWMSDELAKLPRTGGRVPLLVVADAPGAGHRRRALVVVGLEDWIELHGPVAEDVA